MSKIEVINEIINISCDYEKDIYLYLIDNVTHNPDINIKYGLLFIDELLKDFQTTSDIDERAFYIEIIIRILDDLKDNSNMIDRWNNEKINIEGLYRCYIEILLQGYDNEQNISETLVMFVNLNISCARIIGDMVRVLDGNKLITLLSSMKLKPSIGLLDKDIYNNVSLNKKKIKRFDVLLHFYLLVTPQYFTNIEIAGKYLKKYYDYSIICADWIFSSKTQNDNYIKDGILSPDEYDIFVRIGDILEACKSDGDNKNFDDLKQDFRITSLKFEEKMMEASTTKMLAEFWKGKDFFTLACVLP